MQRRDQAEVDPFMADMEQFDRAMDDSMRNMEKSMIQMQRDMEKEAAMNPGSTNFQSYQKSSSKINDEPELVSVKTNNNGKIDNIEEEIGPDGQARILSENSKCLQSQIKTVLKYTYSHLPILDSILKGDF